MEQLKAAEFRAKQLAGHQLALESQQPVPTLPLSDAAQQSPHNPAVPAPPPPHDASVSSSKPAAAAAAAVTSVPVAGTAVQQQAPIASQQDPSKY